MKYLGWVFTMIAWLLFGLSAVLILAEGLVGWLGEGFSITGEAIRDWRKWT